MRFLVSITIALTIPADESPTLHWQQVLCFCGSRDIVFKCISLHSHLQQGWPVFFDIPRTLPEPFSKITLPLLAIFLPLHYTILASSTFRQLHMQTGLGPLPALQPLLSKRGDREV